MDYTLAFGGISSADFGAWITGQGAYNAPARRYMSVDVPGRNGSLTIKGEPIFEDLTVVYPAFIPRNFTQNMAGLRAALAQFSGKQRLADSFHPDEFYMAEFVEALEVEPAPGAVAGAFEIRFKRDPRRFLLTGEQTTTLNATGTINNPTKFNSRPLLRIYGTGTVKIGNNTITITGSDTYIDIDCEMMEAYKGGTNKNQFVSFSQNDFPVLKPGNNNIVLGGSVTSVEITPRWWTI